MCKLEYKINNMDKTINKNTRNVIWLEFEYYKYMNNKNRNLTNIIAIGCIFFITICGIVWINIIDTKALSPLGNTNENYKMVSEEFGDDFSSFIKDNSFFKIYKEKDDILIRIGENNFKVSKQFKYIPKDESKDEDLNK